MMVVLFIKTTNYQLKMIERQRNYMTIMVAHCRKLVYVNHLIIHINHCQYHLKQACVYTSHRMEQRTLS